MLLLAWGELVLAFLADFDATLDGREVGWGSPPWITVGKEVILVGD